MLLTIEERTLIKTDTTLSLEGLSTALAVISYCYERQFNTQVPGNITVTEAYDSVAKAAGGYKNAEALCGDFDLKRFDAAGYYWRVETRAATELN